MKRLFITISIAALTLPAIADNVKATIHADQAGAKINREIYGQFSEHLGSCIYGGLWVGENSQIPNIQGYRKDVFEALKAGWLLCRRLSLDGRYRSKGTTSFTA